MLHHTVVQYETVAPGAIIYTEHPCMYGVALVPILRKIRPDVPRA